MVGKGKTFAVSVYPRIFRVLHVHNKALKTVTKCCNDFGWLLALVDFRPN